MAMTGGTPILLKQATPEGFPSPVKLYGYYRYEQNIDKNTTTVYCGMYVTTPAGYNIGPWTDFNGSHLGTTSYSFDGTITKFNGTKWLVENHDVTFYHEDDGTISEVPIFWKWGVNSPWGGFTNPSGCFNLTFPRIARASTISSFICTYIGSEGTVSWYPKAKTFYHKVKLSCGDWSMTSDAINPNTTSLYTYATTIPYEAANELPNTKYGTIKATLYTYSDSACTNQIGTEHELESSILVPDNDETKPTCIMEFAPVNDDGVAWKDLYVQGISRVQATSVDADCKYGSSPSEYSISVEGKTYGSPYLSNVLSIDGEQTVKGYATDTRGHTGSTQATINVIPYGKPRLLPHSQENEIVCERCTSDGTLADGGIYLRVKAMRSCSKMMDNNTQHNFCTMQYRFKVMNGNYCSWIPLLDRTDTTTDLVDVKLPDVCTSATQSYVVQLRVVDDVGNDAKETFNIPTDSQDFHLKEGGGGAAFGKYSEEEKTLEIAEDWEIKVLGDRWVSLGGLTGMASPTTEAVGRVPSDAVYYRVENGNHVYIAFCCQYHYTGSRIPLHTIEIPEKYRPARQVEAWCSCGWDSFARVIVEPGGWVFAESFVNRDYDETIPYIDGYIDYFI